MKRRDFITLLGGAAAAWPLADMTFALSLTIATAAGRPRLAVLSLYTPEQGAQSKAAFLEGLRRFGYVEGQTIDIDYRYAESDVERLTPLARELIDLKPDIVLAAEPSAARAVKGVAPTVPIVCVSLGDAVIRELAGSYARPGGTVTGIALNVEGLTGKLIELALELVPGTARIGFLSNPTGASMRLFAQEVDVGGRARGIRILTAQATTRDELARAFDRFGKEAVQAVIVPANGLFRNNRALIAKLALATHLPTISAEQQEVEAGGLASYGVDERENYRRAAGYVERILKGAKPGDLPIEFPTRVVLAVNVSTAKALGLTIPPSVLARADEVIE